MSSVSVSTSSENVSTVSDKSKNKASASKAKLVTGIIGAVTILSVCIILAVYLLVLGFEESNESKELKESNASNASKELKEPKELKESKESNASKELKEPKETKELIFAHILFSNGAESGTYSPSFGSNAKEKFEKLFPRGKHQLTDRGSENSALLGKFLKKRYVDSGFLDQEINPVEMYWQSIEFTVCMTTAETVAAAMFPSKSSILPIISNNLPQTRCTHADEYISENKCPGWSRGHFWKAARQCAGVFQDEIYEKITELAENIIKFSLNIDFPFDSPIKEKIGLLKRDYAKVMQFRYGIGDAPLLKINFGPFIDDLIKSLQSAWDSREKKGGKKVKVYTLDDRIISGVLDSFDVFQNYTIAGQEKEPAFNSLVIMELWNKSGKPIVKFYHKMEEVTNEDHQLLDFTSLVRNCDSAECPLEKFTQCCDAVRTSIEENAKACKRKG